MSLPKRPTECSSRRPIERHLGMQPWRHPLERYDCQQHEHPGEYVGEDASVGLLLVRLPLPLLGGASMGFFTCTSLTFVLASLHLRSASTSLCSSTNTSSCARSFFSSCGSRTDPVLRRSGASRHSSRSTGPTSSRWAGSARDCPQHFEHLVLRQLVFLWVPLSPRPAV